LDSKEGDEIEIRFQNRDWTLNRMSASCQENDGIFLWPLSFTACSGD
jgi:hypothetical protein